MKSTDINEKVLDVYGQLHLDWLTPEDIWWNTLRKILNELDEPESVKKEIYAQIQKDIT
ncbi:hypothetical protein [Methanobrevibacter smithii]|jgi:hypothetical protein|uniref:hypothetical protein n=1 Tax=Methanobrevibacter smithii TaxID=2173 RepID=UPI0037DC0C2F